MTHAERVRDAEREALEAHLAYCEAPASGAAAVESLRRLYATADKLRALRAATCHRCGGTGFVVMPEKDGIRTRWYDHCPAGCKEGARP